MNTIIGSKQRMTAVFKEGLRIPVTEVITGPCLVIKITKDETNEVWSVQLGFGQKKLKNTSKALQGHLKLALPKDTKYSPLHVREVKTKEEPTFKVGDFVSGVDMFAEGDMVSVSGTSKGKGFAGGVKRHGFAGGPKTHGQSDRLRAPGSIGQGTTPGRVYKGKRMAGRMGSETITIKNLQVLAVNKEKNTLKIQGAIPGTIDSLVKISKI